MPHSLTKETQVDVLILGAGPAGVFAAFALGKANVDVRIIDQRPSKVAAGQADGIQPRTIEVLQSYGLAERLLKEGNQGHMAAFYNPGPDGGITRTGRAPDVTAPSARYPFKLLLHQGGIESLFLDAMESVGVKVERPIVPISLEWSEDEAELSDPTAFPVRVVLKKQNPKPHEEDTEIVYAKYVIGADGAHSWVRKQLGFTMDGEQTDYIWGVMDTVPDTDFPDIRNRCAIHSTNGSIMIIPRENDMVRLYVQLSGDEVEVTKADRLKWGYQQVQEAAKKSIAPFRLDFPHPLDWWAVYNIGQRVASHFAMKERIFIVGDACHTHSPKAGQGMNASMNDSHNLAWKITHVLRGWAKPDVLKTYEPERRKYAQELIAFDKKFAALFSGKAAMGDTDNTGISHAEFLEAFQSFGDFSSGCGVLYEQSSIVETKHQSLASKLIIGQRLPPQVIVRAADSRPYHIQDLLPSDTRIKILVFSGNTSDPCQRALLEEVAIKLAGESGVLQSYSQDGDQSTVFDVLTISTASKDAVDYTDVPPLLRPHWSKVFIDDLEIKGILGGTCYESYGISKDTGAIVAIRPDGYVGTVVPLEQVHELDAYLQKFLVKQ